MHGTALSLGSTDAAEGGARGDDWLRSGSSRAETAMIKPVLTDGPGWLTRQEKTAVERISEEGSVAQVDPLRLSHFLLEKAVSRGVKLHQPAQATSLLHDSNNVLTGVQITNIHTKTTTTLPCTNLILAAGSWRPSLFTTLFPSSTTTFPITPLAGYSLVVRSPRHTIAHEREINNTSHAIYIAGLNSWKIPVPGSVEELKERYYRKSEMRKVKSVTTRLIGVLPAGVSEAIDGVENVNDLEILREGLCLRPVADRGVPFVTRIDDHLLGNGVRTEKSGGVFIAAGHGPWGISLSLGTGKVVADLVRGVEPSVDVSGLGVGGGDGQMRAKL
ncbi:FAD dependent oxidoreductase-domain-containing protein [Aspergillus crustosus]